jgi:HK97 family phage major capsid protein
MADYLDNLNAARVRLVGEQRKLIDDITKRDTPVPSAEERQTLERMDADIDGIKAEIDAAKVRQARDAENDKVAEVRAAVYSPKQIEQQDRSEKQAFEAFIRGESPGNAEHGRAWDFNLTTAVNTRQMIRMGAGPAEFRALSVVTAAAGGTLVPTGFVNSLYDYMEVYSGARRLNPTILATASGNPLPIPKVVSGGTAAIVGEGTALAGTDPSFGRTLLSTWKIAQLVTLSNELIRDSGVDLEGWLARDFGRALGRATNSLYTTGTGSNQPAGYQVPAGTAVTGANGGTGVPSMNNLIDVVYGINSEYRAAGAAWSMRDATAGYIRKLTASTAGDYLWQPSLQAGQPDRLLGFPVVENSAMPAYGTGIKSICFGDFGSAFVIRDVGSVRVERSEERYFELDQVAWRAVLSTDSQVQDLTAYTAFRGGTA